MVRWRTRSWPRVLVPGAVAVAAVVLAGSASAAALGGGGAWPTAGHDIGNTRDATGEHLIGPGNASRLTTAWQITTAGNVETTPAVAGGVVYFPDSGVISIVAVYTDGGMIEMATIGREGWSSEGGVSTEVPSARQKRIVSDPRTPATISIRVISGQGSHCSRPR